MTDSIQMRQTGESGDYHVFAAKGDEPVKGLALHKTLTDELDHDFSADESGSTEGYVEVELSDDGAVDLEAEKFTGSTFRVSNQPAVRHAYFTPRFVQGYGYDGDLPTEETFDVDGFPSIGISGLSVSDEDTYDETVQESADDAKAALFGESDDSDEAEADSDESDEEEVEVSDEEIGIVD